MGQGLNPPAGYGWAAEVNEAMYIVVCDCGDEIKLICIESPDSMYACATDDI